MPHTEPSYRVQLLPLPIVVDMHLQPVPNSHVVEIVFPSGSVETALGKVNTIAGRGVAKIIVGDMTVRGVPLC